MFAACARTSPTRFKASDQPTGFTARPTAFARLINQIPAISSPGNHSTASTRLYLHSPQISVRALKRKVRTAKDLAQDPVRYRFDLNLPLQNVEPATSSRTRPGCHAATTSDSTGAGAASAAAGHDSKARRPASCTPRRWEQGAQGLSTFRLEHQESHGRRSPKILRSNGESRYAHSKTVLSTAFAERISRRYCNGRRLQQWGFQRWRCQQ